MMWNLWKVLIVLLSVLIEIGLSNGHGGYLPKSEGFDNRKDDDDDDDDDESNYDDSEYYKYRYGGGIGLGFVFIVILVVCCLCGQRRRRRRPRAVPTHLHRFRSGNAPPGTSIRESATTSLPYVRSDPPIYPFTPPPYSERSEQPPPPYTIGDYKFTEPSQVA